MLYEKFRVLAILLLFKIYTDLGLSESCAPTSEEESSDEEHSNDDSESCDDMGENSEDDESDICNENSEFSEDQEELKSLTNVDDGEETGESLRDDERSSLKKQYRNENDNESVES